MEKKISHAHSTKPILPHITKTRLEQNKKKALDSFSWCTYIQNSQQIHDRICNYIQDHIKMIHYDQVAFSLGVMISLIPVILANIKKADKRYSKDIGKEELIFTAGVIFKLMQAL